MGDNRRLMAADTIWGTLLSGQADTMRRAVEAWSAQAVDLDETATPGPAYPADQTTIARPVTVRGPGTFFGGATRTLTFEPCTREGWWFDRADLPEDLATQVSVRNVWTTGQIVSNIVLRSGAPHNYCRMVEHIVALMPGLGLDRLTVKIESGDPPLFERGSLDLVEAIESVGIAGTGVPACHVAVREKVCVCGPNGAFVILAPPSGPEPRLTIDAAVDFPTAIGKQRIRFVMNRDTFRRASVARTNTSASKKFYCQTVGRVFADIRHLGYNKHNLLIAGRHGYHNKPLLIHEGKSLEAAWHRAALDLAAALALVEGGRLVGDVATYRAGHALDVKLISLLHLHDLLVPFPSAGRSA